MLVQAKSTGRQEVLAQRKKLKDASFNDEQTDAILETTEAVAPNLATKSDLASVKTDLENKLSSVETAFENKLSTVKTDLKNETSLFKFEARVLFGITVAVVSASAAKDSPVGSFVKALFT